MTVSSVAAPRAAAIPEHLSRTSAAPQPHCVASCTRAPTCLSANARGAVLPRITPGDLAGPRGTRVATSEHAADVPGAPATDGRL